MEEEMKNDVAIRLQDLRKVYKLYDKPIDRLKEVFHPRRKKYGEDKCVLNGVSLDIERGSVVGIVGTNGAGKSTLLKIVTGVLFPTSGTAQINGKVAALLELGAGFNPEFTGIKNIYLNGTMMGFSKEEMDKKLPDIVAFADIGDFINQPVKTYSSGMFARLAFSVAINVEPDILVVDEALSVGDLRFQMKCMDKMKSLMDSGVTVLFVSHDINAIRRLCTKTLWLKDGNVQKYGDTNKICDEYLDYLKVGEIAAMQVQHGKDEEEEEQDATKIKEFVAGAKEQVGDIAGIKLLNKDGEVVDKINNLEPFTVELHYDVYDTEVDYPVLGVALKRIDDEYICGLNTLLDEVKIPWNYGRNTFKLTYDNGIRVIGGGYYLDVALFEKTATVPIRYWAKAIEFTVSANYVGEGVCIIPHIWSE